MGSGRARGPGARSIGGKEREGELGREQPGQGAKLGEDAGLARRSAMVMAWRAGTRGEVRSGQGRPGSSKPGARGWFWAEARRVGRPGGVCAGVRRRRGRGAGRRRWKKRSVAIS